MKAAAASLPSSARQGRVSAHEEDRLPVLRPLDALAAVRHAVRRRCAAAVDRPRRRRRGARRRRRLFPRASFRPPARLAVPAARRRRRADQAHRDRHRRHRHALREPALHGRGCRRRRPHRRRPAAARHQPRLARAGDRRLALFRLRAGRGRDRCRHGAPPRRGVSRLLRGQGFAKPNPRPMFPNPPGLLRARAVFGRPARAHLVGRRHQRHGRMGGEARHEPAELDAEIRRERRAVPRPAGRADPRLSARPGRRRATRATPRVSVSRSIFALVDDRDRAYFGRDGEGEDQIGFIDEQHARGVRPQLRRRAGRAGRAAARRTRPSPRPTRSCSPSPTSSASTTTPTSSRRSSSTSPRRSAGADACEPTEASRG